MTNMEAFAAFASVIESNPRYMELTDKKENQTITEEELTELNAIIDSVFFSPFQMKNFHAIDEEDDPEEEAQIKATIQSMADRGIIKFHRPE